MLRYLSQAVEISRENLELLSQFEQVAQARYRVSVGQHPDLIKAQVELGSAEDRLAQLIDLHGPFAARLNASLNTNTYSY